MTLTQFLKTLRKTLPFSLLLLLLLSRTTSAQGPAAIHHEHSTSHLVQYSMNGKTTVGLLIDLEKGWHTYYKEPGESGAAPRFNFSDLKTAPQFNYPTPQVFEASRIVTYGYEDQVLFWTEILDVGATAKGTFSFEYLVCRELCIPAIGEFALGDKTSAPEFQQLVALYEKRLPKTIESPLFELQSTAAQLEIKIPEYPLAPPEIVFVSPSELVGKKPEIHLDSVSKLLSLKFPVCTESAKTEADCLQTPEAIKSADFILVRSDHPTGAGTRVVLGVAPTPAPESPPAAQPSLLLILLSALLGGLLLNLMPCVLPVLSLKIFSVIKASSLAPRERRRRALFYLLGILVSFISLGLFFSLLKESSGLFGWGFQLQSPLFVALLGVLFVWLALISLDVVGVPAVTLTNKVTPQFSPNVEEFMSGVLITITSTPCTAPFMGSALGYALTRPSWELVLVFAMIGFGLGVPLVIMGYLPNTHRWLPRPGAWMVTLKKLFAFPLLATALWMAWLFGKLTVSNLGFGLIGYHLCFAFILWLMSKRQGHTLKLRLVVLALCTLAFAFFWFSFVSPAPLSKVSESKEVAQAGILWSPFQGADLSSLQKSESPYFIDVTANWCLSCQVNERLTFSNTEVQGFIKKHQLQMIRADWTSPNPEIVKLLKNYQRIGIPFYLAGYKNKVVVFPEVLTPQIFLNTWQKELSLASAPQVKKK